jgi:choice-of-anchor B domain-containing protein
MKWTTIATALAAVPLASAALFAKEQYRSGEVMEKMMAAKEGAWAKQRAAGAYDNKKWKDFHKKRVNKNRIECKHGRVEAVKGDPDQTYKCKDIDLYDFKTHEELGNPPPVSEGSGSWGWTHKGREFIAIGQTNGTAFAEVTSKGELEYLGRLPAQASPVIWHEMKVLNEYLFVGSEGEGHGVQIFDLKKLLKLSPKKPKTFDPATDLTAWFNDLTEGKGIVGRSHNVVTNQEKGYAVAVGSGGRAGRNDTCAGGLIFINVDDITKPYKEGCAPQDGYVHDAQCIVYRGPHKKYYGRDICYGYNEDTLTIYDVTNKKGFNASTIISRTPYKGASYTHQGWVLDPMWQTHLVMDDELDEGEIDGGIDTHPDSVAKDGYPATYIWDITNLEAPKNSGYYKSTTRAVDHNQFVHDGLAYQSNYQAGLRILDVSSIPRHPDGSRVKEIAYFDVFPGDDAVAGGGQALWDAGTWSHYTFPSGYTVINTIDRGAFVVKPTFGRGKGKYFGQY